MLSVVRWTCRSERSEDRNVHRPERSSALRSLDERTAALPTERVPPVQQSGRRLRRHRTNNVQAL